MATASENTVPELVAPANEQECSVCHEPFSEPKLLPCGHMLCRHCLLSWVKSKRRAACPLCRWPIVQEEGADQASAVSSVTKGESGGEGDGGNTEVDETKLQALVDSFPTDLSMAALVQAERLLDKKNRQCRVCEDVQATSLCLHCGDLLCAPCKKGHGKLSATQHHTVEDLSTITADRLAEFQSQTPCPQHPAKACELFCPQHATSLCVLCVLSQHKGCSDFKGLEDQADEVRKVLLELIKKLASGETELDVALAELEQHMAEVEQKTEAALAEIRTLRGRLHKSVDDCCDRLELKTSEARDDIRGAVTLAKTILLGRKSRMGSHKTVVERSNDSKARDVICGMTAVLETRVKDLEYHVTLPESAKVITTATLVVDENAVRRVEQELAKLGEVKVEHAKVAANVIRPNPLQFHENHGKNIVLSNGNKTAERTLANDFAVVAVSTPMMVNQLIEVHIDTWTINPSCAYTSCKGPILGVLTQSPGCGDANTMYLGHIGKAIAIYNGQIGTFGVWNTTSHPVKEHLNNLGAGSRVGLCLDNDYNLHLYVNGQDKGSFASKVPQPCYAAFDVVDYTEKITLLPSTQVA